MHLLGLQVSYKMRMVRNVWAVVGFGLGVLCGWWWLA